SSTCCASASACGSTRAAPRRSRPTWCSSWRRRASRRGRRARPSPSRKRKLTSNRASGINAEMSRFYVTTPIYYVSDVPHLGHAYTTIVCDALARYHRMRGDATRFLTGTDEHGQKIARLAEAHHVSPRAYADKFAEAYQATWRALEVQ